MFLFPFFNNPKSKQETDADKQFLEALRQNKGMRIINGAVYVEGPEIERKMNTFREAARRMIKRRENRAQIS